MNDRILFEDDRLFWHWGSPDDRPMGTRSFAIVDGWITAEDETEAATLADLMDTRHEGNRVLVPEYQP